MDYTAGVITLSDKGYSGERKDTSGAAAAEILKKKGWDVIYRSILPDNFDEIKSELERCCDELDLSLICTTGGTGFSKRDVTPEATLAVVERQAKGIPEAMRAESRKFTDRAMLSRAEAGIRGSSLIINLPGSEKAVRECLGAILDTVKHGVEILRENTAECGSRPENSEKGTPGGMGSGESAQEGKVIAVCVSDKKGEQKHEIPIGHLRENHGLEGDAHAGSWHRQVSLLATESVGIIQNNLAFPLKAGDFAENILTEGISLHKLPIGTKLRLGEALCQITQIGKECHRSCAIREKAGDCVMPREGVFVKILKSGKVKKGDAVVLY